jgi:hypothetical protein
MGLGLVTASAGLALVWLIGWLSGWWVGLVIGALLGGGGFAIFEARKRWCAVRALGFRTPL